MFKYDGTFIRNEKGGRVLMVQNEVDDENRKVITWDASEDKIAQQWDIVYVDEYPEEPKKGELNEKYGLYVQRDFYVVSGLKSNRYLEAINNRNLVIKTPNGNKGQIWYFDQTSLTIKTRINNQSWDIKSAGKTNVMQIWSTNSGWFQLWKYENGHFVTMNYEKHLDAQ
jgi:membrane carboxypeptidase/penicillin-binding protein PbpC